MEYQQLGNSELQISRIGFGCMSLKPGQSNSIQVLEAAVNAGINHFDTADLYEKGINEEQVGAALKPFRQKIILATKAGNQWRQDGTGWDWNPSKEYIMRAAEESLKRLQTDYIDLFQLHGGTIEDPIDETIEAFERLKDQGKIRHYGISSIRPNVIREYIRRSAMVSVMMQVSLLDQRPLEESVPLLAQHSIGVLARGTLAGGILTGKPASPYLGYSQEVVSHATETIRELSSADRRPAHTAIRFVLQQPGITSAVLGIRTMEQLDDAASVFDSPALTPEEYQQLLECIPAKRYADHR
jgi:aryl-alcohol dehydrogenase-like predicted oxidoreductase